MAGVVVSGGILAYELVLSAPKSVSVAALAGPRVDGRILEAHLSAVDDVLSMLAPYLFERRMEKSRTLVIPANATVMGFTHPWNRAVEPQLHSHLTIARQPGGNALWGYPLYLLQRTLRAVYHFSLAGRLRRKGFQIRVGDPGSLAWELAGIAGEAILEFTERAKAIREQVSNSPRGCFSQAVETRLVALASRREMPKTNPLLALDKARGRWARKVGPEHCVPARPLIGDSVSFREPVKLKEVFRSGSVISPAQFQGVHLTAWLGSPIGLRGALHEISELVEAYEREGKIKREGRGICFHEVFEAEEEILGRLAEGYRGGGRCRWHLPGLRKNKWLGKVLGPVAELSDRIRIGCVFGERLPQGVRLEDQNGADITAAVFTMERWDAFSALKFFDGRREENSVLLVREGFRKGDFLQRLHRLMPWYRGEDHMEVGETFRVFKKNVRVISGDLSALLPPSSGKLLFVKRITRALRRAAHLETWEKTLLEPEAVVWGSQFSDEEIAALNGAILKRRAGKGGVRQQLCEEVPWSKISDWSGLGIFCLRNVDAPGEGFESDPHAGSYRHGDTWWFSGPPRDGSVPARGLKRPRMISLSHLRHVLQGKQAGNLVLVRRKEVAVAHGMAFLALKRFTDKAHLFREGEVMVLRSIAPDGAWIFADGARLENPSRLLRPVAAVRGFVAKQRALPRVITDILPNSGALDRLMTLPCNGAVTVVSSNAKELCRKIRVDLSSRRQVKQHETAKKILFAEGDDEDDGFFPPRSRWAELLARDGVRIPPDEPGEASLSDTVKEISFEEVISPAAGSGEDERSTSEKIEEAPTAGEHSRRKRKSESPPMDPPANPAGVETRAPLSPLMPAKKKAKKNARRGVGTENEPGIHPPASQAIGAGQPPDKTDLKATKILPRKSFQTPWEISPNRPL